MGYLHLPWEGKGKDTPNARHVAAFREGVLRYLRDGEVEQETDRDEIDECVNDKLRPNQQELAAAAAANQTKQSEHTTTTTESTPNKEQTKPKQSDNRIAFCHFHPKLIEQLLKEKGQYMLKRYRWRISIPLAQEIGLDIHADKCPDPDENGQPTCYALPNYPLQKALSDIEAAEQAYALKVQECKSTQTKLAQQIISNPYKYALEISTLREANSRLMAEVQELKSRLKSEHAARHKIQQKNESMDRRLVKTQHRLEKVVEAKKAVVPRGRPPKTDSVQQYPTIPGLVMPTTMGGRVQVQIAQPGLLEQVNFPSRLTSHDEKWEFRYSQLMEYRNRFGSCDVPRKWKVNKSLGKWVSAVAVLSCSTNLF